MIGMNGRNFLSAMAIPGTFWIRRRMGRTHHRLTPQKDVCRGWRTTIYPG
jgi:hypothetical protein